MGEWVGLDEMDESEWGEWGGGVVGVLVLVECGERVKSNESGEGGVVVGELL